MSLTITAADSREVLDRDGVLWSIGGDLNFLREMAGLFLAACPTLLGEIRSALASGHHDHVEDAAHLLKGSARNLAANHTFQAAQRLEEAARRGNTDVALEAYNQLEDAVNRLVPAISQMLVEARRSAVAPHGI